MQATEYDAWYNTDRGRWIGGAEYSLILKRLEPRPGDCLLDVGCGTGWFTRKLSGLPSVTITGVDIDQDALAFAQARDPAGNYMTADARQLPFQDKQFDRVVSITALCFVDPWETALSEIVRVSNGRFVIGLLNRNSLLWRNKGQHGGKGAYRGAYWHTAKELRIALAQLPVSNINIDSAVFLPDGSGLARFAEKVLASSLPFGSFLMVSGDRITHQ